MTTRRTGTLSALLVTAALFLCLPGLLRSLIPADSNRMHESLRPPRMKTVAVWLLPGETEDRKLISRACAAFEKEHPGVRIFLRAVDAEELASPDAVLPDVALYETGSLNFPEKVFLPIAGEAESSGMFAGVSYGAPLWLSPYVLSLPMSWLAREKADEPRQDSLLAAATPQPTQDARAVILPEELPWEKLIMPGAIEPPQGTALSQLLCMCPYALRGRLKAAVFTQTQAECARVRTLSAHLAAARKGENLAGCVLTPAVSDRVRYVSLCRESDEARSFVTFLRSLPSEEALSLGLLPLREEIASADALMGQVISVFERQHTLPNAFAHTREEIQNLCYQGFDRLTDPVETLLRLR